MKRPTLRIPDRQHEMIQAELQRRDVSFQEYVLNLIYENLNIPEEPDVIVDGQLELELTNESK